MRRRVSEAMLRGGGWRCIFSACSTHTRRARSRQGRNVRKGVESEGQGCGGGGCRRASGRAVCDPRCVGRGRGGAAAAGVGRGAGCMAVAACPSACTHAMRDTRALPRVAPARPGPPTGSATHPASCLRETRHYEGRPVRCSTTACCPRLRGLLPARPGCNYSVDAAPTLVQWHQLLLECQVVRGSHLLDTHVLHAHANVVPAIAAPGKVAARGCEGVRRSSPARVSSTLTRT